MHAPWTPECYTCCSACQFLRFQGATLVCDSNICCQAGIRERSFLSLDKPASTYAQGPEVGKRGSSSGTAHLCILSKHDHCGSYTEHCLPSHLFQMSLPYRDPAPSTCNPAKKQRNLTASREPGSEYEMSNYPSPSGPPGRLLLPSRELHLQCPLSILGTGKRSPAVGWMKSSLLVRASRKADLLRLAPARMSRSTLASEG